MNIGIDARSIAVQRRVPRAGISRVAVTLIRELIRLGRKDKYFLYSPRPIDEKFSSQNVIWHGESHLGCCPAVLWFGIEGRKLMIRNKLDTFWGIGQVFPPGVPSSVSRVLTVHDLVWHLYPKTMSVSGRAVSRLLVERSIRDADVIVSVSQSTATDLITLLGISASKIRVIPHGVSAIFCPQDGRRAAEYISKKYGTSPNYICAVGTLEPRKNLAKLVEAVGILHGRRGFSFQLLIAGGEGWKYSKIYDVVERQGLTTREIRFLGFLPESDLPSFYAGAKAFVFPSLYEGFGLPVVEAMACGVPVVASDIPTNREVGAGAVLLVPPDDAEAMARAITHIIENGDVKSQLIKRGLKVSRLYCWQTAAVKYAEVFAEI